MVAARIIVVVALAAAFVLPSSTAAETPADCLNRCISKCVDARGGLCTFNCALGCKWPHSEPTGEVMVNQPQIDPAATKAAFAMYEEPEAKGTHPATKP
ncbi:hypothetical protein SASPL_147401 [Salvia splendens]|uniref:Uncharacterized protein n=1 Tax=Salvia splendens TaxID=180675 RepID=A0A8X8WFR1_SALSN|nr:hypothetical protein SASPL_147401 [Salvia splendens]